MLLTVPVTHNLNIINDISTRRQGYCYFMILSVFLFLFTVLFRENQSFVLYLFNVSVVVFSLP